MCFFLEETVACLTQATLKQPQVSDARTYYGCAALMLAMQQWLRGR